MISMRGNECFRRSLRELVAATGAAGIRMLEVGSYAGESAEIFASIPEVAEIWCIDPWAGGYDSTDPASSSDFAEVERAFDAALARNAGKMRKFKGTLQEFLAAHPEARPDLVYIDGEHTYAGCRKDILAALEMRPGFLAGHDYAGYCKGVVDAVNDTIGKPDRTWGDASWLKKMR